AGRRAPCWVRSWPMAPMILARVCSRAPAAGTGGEAHVDPGVAAVRRSEMGASGEPTAGQLPRCASCGEPFACGGDAPGGCWCARLEPVSERTLTSLARFGERCLCPRCLGVHIAPGDLPV